MISLRERYGETYRVSHDESYQAERSEFRSAEEPWLQIIMGAYGHIYVHGREQLAVSLNSRRLLGKLLAIPGTAILQDADDGANVAFPTERIHDVAAMILSRKRRHCHLSPEQRKKLADVGRAALAKHRAISHDGSEGQACTISPLVDIQATGERSSIYGG